ncbi:MAG: hypothetical protein VX768_01105 [Planctomycetota bacterium]|nr:hypothetical protein [Planctomycetota bacterium]
MMQRKKIYGVLAAILCGTGLYFVGYCQKDIQLHSLKAEHYTQGYKTGYLKAFREFKKRHSLATLKELETPGN